MAVTPTQRTLKYLRDQGYTAQVVEKWVERARKRIDLFGFIDIVAIGRPTPASGEENHCRLKHGEIIGVQCTSTAHHADHRRKILVDCGPAAMEWCLCGGRILLISWRKLKVKRGGKAMRWVPREEWIHSGHFYEQIAKGGPDAADLEDV